MAPPTASAAAPRRRQASAGGLRWDRVVRLLLGLGLVVMLVMYASSLVGIVTASSERGDRAAEVQALQRDHDALVARQKSLRRTDGVEVEARRLGMVKLGEVPVVVTGLPGDAGR